MSSTSISSLILFIAAMIVAAGVAGTLVTAVTDVSGSVSTQTGNTAETIDTDIEIISDAGSDAVYDGDTVTLYVKNTGENTLASDGSGLDVVLDGEYVVSEAYVDDGSEIELHGDDHWRPGAVAELEIDLAAADLEDGFDAGGEHRAVVTINETSAVFEFRT
ncbi:flagellar protein G [Natronococcus occultus]|uniref:Putative archaeal flagellar protein G n=1 Tax=Natronococcus occultus SP4 TaxID=694430 RepID=L0JZC0_9EURY|nr:flagellar protein G [Natronococcus occultus]AGB38106.1 putative archaeal flagellar protein G [Natronococcus occultus SP4]